MHLNKASLADQVYEILRADIIKQVIKCGEKLTLKTLQERFGISSTPIREAINKLCQEGLVEHVTNVGARVIELNANDIRELYDFCSCLDIAALNLAISCGKPDEIAAELDNNIERQKNALVNNDIEGFLYHAAKFHLIFYKYADNSRLQSAARLIDGQFTLLSTLFQSSAPGKEAALSEHEQIAAAIKIQDITKATELMAKHFEHAKNYLVALPDNKKTA